MDCERDVLASRITEVPVIEGQVVTAIRTLAGRGVGKKAIAREVGVAVNTVRRYLRAPIMAGQQVRPAARRLTDDRRGEARTLYEGPAGGNATAAPSVMRGMPSVNGNGS
jgi:predicted transcriptional regulator